MHQTHGLAHSVSILQTNHTESESDKQKKHSIPFSDIKNSADELPAQCDLNERDFTLLSPPSCLQSDYTNLKQNLEPAIEALWLNFGHQLIDALKHKCSDFSSIIDQSLVNGSLSFALLSHHILEWQENAHPCKGWVKLDRIAHKDALPARVDKQALGDFIIVEADPPLTHTAVELEHEPTDIDAILSHIVQLQTHLGHTDDLERILKGVLLDENGRKIGVEEATQSLLSYLKQATSSLCQSQAVKNSLFREIFRTATFLMVSGVLFQSPWLPVISLLARGSFKFLVSVLI